jgi:hypothetical protein
MEYRMNALRSLVLAAAAIVALACTTGPKDSLSGAWGEVVGVGLSLSLRQSGSVVAGMVGFAPCLATPVSGSIHGSDFELQFDTGASATNYAGSFINPSTISMQPSPMDPDVDIAPMVFSKEPAAALGKCATPQT